MLDNLGTVIGNNSMFSTILDGPGLKLAHINAQSLTPGSRSTKFDEIRNLFNDSIIDIIGVSETWLSACVASNCVGIHGFNIYRNDRIIRRGGGVCLYISNKLKTRYGKMEEGLFESLFVEIMTGRGQNILVGVIYLPHRIFNACRDDIIDITSRYENVVLMGDFNVDIFTRREEVYAFCNRSSLSVVHNSQPTHYSSSRLSTSLIDYYFVSNIDQVQSKGQFQLPALNSNHSMICITYNVCNATCRC